MDTSLFQVDLNGVLKVLSDSLYSSYQVFIRELLQNSIDAINARKSVDGNFEPSISVSYFSANDGSRTICVEDNGVGLTLEEVDEFLSRIGSSSKSRNSSDRDTFIGQFGIGLLSCFMISDEVVVLSRSAKTGEAVKWIGNIDGSYQKSAIAQDLVTGTKVFLKVKDSVKLDDELLEKLLHRYGTYLEVPVHYSCNDHPRAAFQKQFPWLKQGFDDSALRLGKEKFKEDFRNYIPLRDRSGKTTGIAYIIPRQTHSGNINAHSVYIKRMFITDNCTDLLPDWAFFVKAVINSENLSPTASREEIYKNTVLEDVREDLGNCIKDYLVSLSENDPEVLTQIIQTHHQALKFLALHDEVFFDFICRWFSFPTSEGVLNLKEIQERTKTILYVSELDHFRQILPVARANQQLVVNAGYIYDTEIFDLLSSRDKTALYQSIDVEYFGNILNDVSIEVTDRTEARIRELQYHVEMFSCALELKSFSPESLPVIFFMSQQSLLERDITSIKNESDDLWADITSAVFDFSQTYHSRLFLNWNNPIIRRLLEMPKSSSDALFMETIYINSMLLGHYPLNNREMEVMNNNLEQLLQKIL